MAYTKSQQRKKEESGRLRGEGEEEREKRRGRRGEGEEEREIRSSSLILDLKERKLNDSGKAEGKIFHKLHVLGMNDNLWNRARGLWSENWKGCE